MWPVCASSPSTLRLRVSARSTTRFGMMLLAIPPSMRPMFAVVSASTRPRRMAAMASAATLMALMPCSGAIPACASSPCTVNCMRLAAGARVMSSWTPSQSRTRPVRARRRPTSKCLAPTSPSSSQIVSSTSMGPCGIRHSRNRRTASRMATMPDLSSPPSIVVPSERMMSPSTTGRMFSPGTTVSMCAHSRNGAISGAVPGKRASMLPVSAPTRGPASSISTVAPMPVRISCRRRAMLPSRLETLEIRTSSRNSSRSRGTFTAARSAKESPQPVAAGLHRAQAVRHVGETVVAAGNDEQVARLPPLLVQPRAVIEADHLVGVAVHAQVPRHARGRQRVVALHELQRERDAEIAVLLEIVVGELGEAGRRVPRHHRRAGPPCGDEQRDESSQARAEQAKAAIEPRMPVEQRQYRLDVLDPAGHRRLVLAAARLAAPAKVEARQREPRRGQRVAEQQVLVGVLGSVKPVTGDHIRHSPGTIRKMEHEGQLRGGKRHEVVLDRYAHTRSNSRTALLESWNIVSSMGSRLILATSSATREASHGPESIALNSPP